MLKKRLCSIDPSLWSISSCESSLFSEGRDAINSWGRSKSKSAVLIALNSSTRVKRGEYLPVIFSLFRHFESRPLAHAYAMAIASSLNNISSSVPGNICNQSAWQFIPAYILSELGARDFNFTAFCYKPEHFDPV